MRTDDSEVPHPANGGQRPDPDPTVLTTQALYREVGQLRELLGQRIRGLEDERDRETQSSVRRMETLNRERTEQMASLREVVEERIIGLGKLVDEKFTAGERLRIEQKKDTKDAVDAALSAAKEAVKEQTSSSEKSIAKSEAATGAQLAQQQETFSASIESLRRSIDELKDRAGEDNRNLRQSISDVATTANGTIQRQVGVVDNRQEHTDSRVAVYTTVGLVVSLVVAGIAIVGLMIKLGA